MALFRFRFRKSIPIIPKVFYITINKRSISWNLRLGPYSRTWGKDHITSTIDAPGTFGASWRKVQRKKENEEKESSGIVLTFLGLILASAALYFVFHGEVIIWAGCVIAALACKWFFSLENWLPSLPIAVGAYIAVLWII